MGNNTPSDNLHQHCKDTCFVGGHLKATHTINIVLFAVSFPILYVSWQQSTVYAAPSGPFNLLRNYSGKLSFSAVDLAAQACAREAFDPEGRMNPAKVLPLGSRCGELVLDAGSLPPGTWL